MFGPRLSFSCLAPGPPNKLLLASSPVPAAFGEAAFFSLGCICGVGADDDDFEGCTTQRGVSISMLLPSTDRIGCGCGAAGAAGCDADCWDSETGAALGGVGECCAEPTKPGGCGACMGVRVAYDTGLLGGSIRLLMEGEADARLMWGEACAEGMPFAVSDDGCGAESMMEPRIGSKFWPLDIGRGVGVGGLDRVGRGSRMKMSGCCRCSDCDASMCCGGGAVAGGAGGWKWLWAISVRVD